MAIFFQFQKQGSVCRKVKTNCDVPEYCSGDSSDVSSSGSVRVGQPYYQTYLYSCLTPYRLFTAIPRQADGAGWNESGNRAQQDSTSDRGKEGGN